MTTATRHPTMTLAPLLAPLLVMASLTGCAAGVITSTTYAAAGTSTALWRKQQEAFHERLAEDYLTYRELLTQSDCDPDEYRISPEIFEFIWDSPPTEDGYGKATDILQRIYQDQSQPENVRAHALYTLALIEGANEESDPEISRQYLRQVQEEFPGTHDCAINLLLKEGQKF